MGSYLLAGGHIRDKNFNTNLLENVDACMAVMSFYTHHFFPPSAWGQKTVRRRKKLNVRQVITAGAALGSWCVVDTGLVRFCEIF